MRAEGAAFGRPPLASFFGGGLDAPQQGQHGLRATRPEQILGLLDPGRRLGGAGAMDRRAHGPQGLTTVIPIQDCPALLAERGGHVLPDPAGAIAEDHHPPPHHGRLPAASGALAPPAADGPRSASGGCGPETGRKWLACSRAAT
jgi:hypothetical protein